MANLAKIVMPKWGMEMAEGELAEWHVAVGDAVTEGNDIVDVETAKIVNTVTASASGTVVRLCGNPGDVIPVGGALVVLADGAVSEAEIDSFLGVQAGAAVSTATPAEAEPTPSAPTSTPTVSAPTVADAPAAVQRPNSDHRLNEGPDDSAVEATVVARRVAKDNQINLHNVAPTGRLGRVTLADLQAAAQGAGLSLRLPDGRQFDTAVTDDGAVEATPVARRLAQQLGVPLSACRASGRHGRVAKADVEAAAVKLGKIGQTTTAAPALLDDTDAPTHTKLAGMRKVIAQRVSQSKQQVPHFRVNMDVDVSAAMALRKQLNDSRKDVKISLNDVLIKAVACALTRNPALNARFDGETLSTYSDIHLSSAVAVEGGVLMPVLRNVQTKGLASISQGMRDLATRAKISRLTGDELDGGTFSISNLGMFGITSFDAIINQPQVAILAVGAAEQRAIVRDGELTTGLIMSMSVASDHRVVDGADAAKFLADLKGFMEQPASMLG